MSNVIMRALVVLSLLFSTAFADEPLLYRRIADDLRVGRPLVVEVHLALCDNTQVRCGGHGLGDGEKLATNLYWATTGGLRGWFERAGSGWTKRATVGDEPFGDVLATRVYTRRVAPSDAWRARGVEKPFDVYVVAHAWRGPAIGKALAQFVTDLSGTESRRVALEDGTTLEGAAHAHVLGYVGHNGLMDLDGDELRRVVEARSSDGPARGYIAMACASSPYLRHLASTVRTPLALTTDLMFASSPALDAVVQALANGGTLAELRQAAARGYALEQKKEPQRLLGAFTNPADPRWSKSATR